MRNLGLAKKALLLALCAALAVPAAGMGWTPLTAEAAQPPVKSNNAANTVQTLTEAEQNGGADIKISAHFIHKDNISMKSQVFRLGFHGFSAVAAGHADKQGIRF